jgi:hypothetical protein
MSWTKRDLVVQAFDAIGLNVNRYQLQADDLESARRTLDAMMGMWDASGIKLGYTLPQSANGSDLDEESGLSQHSVLAVYSNLSILLADVFGKAVPNSLAITAKKAYDTLAIKAAQPGQRQFPGNMPIGAGNRGHSHFPRFSTMPDDNLGFLD